MRCARLGRNLRPGAIRPIPTSPQKTKRANKSAPLGPLPMILVSNRGGCANASFVPSKSFNPALARRRLRGTVRVPPPRRAARRQSKDRHGPPTQRNAWEKPLEGKNSLKTAKPTPPDRDGEYSSQGRFGRRAAELGGKHKEGEAFGDHRFGGPAPFCRFSNGFRILPARCLRRRANFDGFRARFLFFFLIFFGAPRYLHIEVLFRQAAGQAGKPRALARAGLLAPRRKSNMIARSRG